MLRTCLRLFSVLILGLMLHGKAVAAARFHVAPMKPAQANSHRNRYPLNICGETSIPGFSLTDTRLPSLIGLLSGLFYLNALFSQITGITKGTYAAPLLRTTHQLLFPFHVFW